MSTRTRNGHDAWTLLGVGVVALAAAVLSFSSLQDLAERAGYTPKLAALLPLAIDAQAVVATRAWLATNTPVRARGYARTLALAAVAGSVAGNAGQHAMAAAHAVTPWWVVVAIASVPPVALAATAHLAALLATHRPADEHTARAPEPSTTDVGERATEPHSERVTERPDDARPSDPVSARTTAHHTDAVSAQQATQPSRTTARTKSRAKRSPKGQARARALFDRHAEAGTVDQLTGSDIATAGNVSAATGRRWLAAWRSDHDADRPQLAVVGESAT
ncbi:DUF2637 domain-containing protein [Haloechinothrix salitolerans]|uniref:DUF2637 domain-containing protein n=1 Tax=Haloechinothrix salitolerans TaxID=926830 RepID=A0ABW2BSQ2_9PSEU